MYIDVNSLKVLFIFLKKQVVLIPVFVRGDYILWPSVHSNVLNKLVVQKKTVSSFIVHADINICSSRAQVLQSYHDQYLTF